MSTQGLAVAQATAAELPVIAAALAEAGLTIADLGLPNRRLYCLRDRDGAVVALSGLEVYAVDALLRSVLVVPTRRRHGLGRTIVALTMDEAAALGARRIFLLTTDAQPFFERLGFVAIARKQAPPAIAATAEFERLCPATATCMMKMVGPPL
jgi:amino-acid N-acetyltransferase